jgi:hypothetical protein
VCDTCKYQTASVSCAQCPAIYYCDHVRVRAWSGVSAHGRADGWWRRAQCYEHYHDVSRMPIAHREPHNIIARCSEVPHAAGHLLLLPLMLSLLLFCACSSCCCLLFV